MDRTETKPAVLKIFKKTVRLWERKILRRIGAVEKKNRRVEYYPLKA